MHTITGKIKSQNEKQIDYVDILNISDAAKSIEGRPCVIVTGVTGQDGSHMVDYILNNTGYEVVGCVRRLSVYNHRNISHIDNPRFRLVNFDLFDQNGILKLIERLRPAFFINLAAQSFVGSSWDFALQTWETNSTAVLNIIEAIRVYNPACRFYQAGSSEEFGDVVCVPQTEDHPLNPRSPYGASKAAARQIINVWRKAYNLYAIQGWLYNHEGPRRGEEFVTRKITTGVARIKRAMTENKQFSELQLGNLDAKRDWSDAEDIVRGIWLNLNQDSPRDYILSSNEVHTVREFVEVAFEAAEIEGVWDGCGVDEVFRCSSSGAVLLRVNKKYYRPNEKNMYLGDSSRARIELGWIPKVGFRELVRKMVLCDMNR